MIKRFILFQTVLFYFLTDELLKKDSFNKQLKLKTLAFQLYIYIQL
jgi:hypothetical protein